MKKLLTLVLAALLAVPSLARALGAGEDAGQWADEDLFRYEHSTDGAQNIVPASEGYRCDIAYVGGWTVSMEHTGDSGDGLGILGLPDFEEEQVVLVEDGGTGIIPCGDSFVYYGKGSDGRHHWLARKPGEEPTVLPIPFADEVFYGDKTGVWYASLIESGRYRLYRTGLDGRGKRNLGAVRGTICGVLSNGRIVLLNTKGDKVTTWRDGKTATLYVSPSGEPIRFVATTDEQVWVVCDSYFGRIENGELRDRQEGSVRASARSGLQLVMLVIDQQEAAHARVMLMNDVVQSYTNLGSVPYTGGAQRTSLVLRTDCVVVRGQATNVLPIPADASAWTLYGD
ncbi:MAG: hypothetical protein LBU67_08600 [Oscillospiraceae bacterium]|jgi:hypothetical protein|nr:hypothetical protein [Oscillospiraceae bacterium]